MGDDPVLDPTLIDWLNPWLLVLELEVDFKASILVSFLLVMLISPLTEAIDPLMLVFPLFRGIAVARGSPSAELGGA